MTVSPAGLQKALAALGGVPDCAMSMLMWWRDEHGDLVRPCTREEIRSGLLGGTIDPTAVITMARVAALTTGDIVDITARHRRQQFTALPGGYSNEQSF